MKRGDRKRINALLEENASKFRLASSQIDRIIETLPVDRYRGQRVALENLRDAFDLHATELTVHIRDLDLASLGLLARFGGGKAGMALLGLAWVGKTVVTGGLEGLGADLVAAEQAVDATIDCSHRLEWEVTGDITEIRVGGDDSQVEELLERAREAQWEAEQLTGTVDKLGEALPKDTPKPVLEILDTLRDEISSVESSVSSIES